jgi:hypothetical protein
MLSSKALSPLIVGASLMALTTAFTSANAQETTAEETHLHDIYEQYYSQPTDPSAWEQLTSSLKSEKYEIQPGDNLWQISKIFFGDGNYWPKVWSVNSGIENPHLIETGNEIHFRLGTSDSEPAFLVTEKNGGGGGAEDLATTTEVVPSDPNAPYHPKPVLKNLPPSFPQWQGIGPQKSNFDKWGVEILPRPELKLVDQAYLQSFVIEGPFDPVGQVVESQMEDQVMSQGNIIYVRFKEGTVAMAGQSYLIVADSGALSKEADRAYNRAHVLRVSGQITLLSPLQADDPEPGYFYYKARIDKSLDLALRGQKLVPGKMKTIHFAQAGRVKDMEVDVIGGSLDNNGFQFSSGNVVYLDKGRADGVSDGDIFVIQSAKKRKFLEPEPLVRFTRVQSGQVQVVDTRDHYSTAVILGGARELHPGDRSF